MDDITIKQFTKAELIDIYDDSAFWQHEDLPFTRPRLACYLHNSRAELEDVLLVGAFEGSKIVGYLILVPERVNSLKGALKVTWNSSWWIHPKHRGSWLTGKIATTAFEICDLVPVDSATRVALMTGMAYCDYEFYQERQRKHYFLGMNRKILKDFQVSNPLIYMALPLVRPILNCISKIRLKRWLAKHKQSGLKAEYIHRLDQESLDLMLENADRELIYKDADYLEYRAFLPLKLSNPTFIPKKYHSFFGNVGSQAECRIVKLWQGEELAGVVNYCIVDNSLTIRFHYLRPTHEDKLIYLMAKLCCEYYVDRITTHDAYIIERMQALKLPYLFCKTIDMPIYLSKPLIDKVKPGLHLFDGEGAF